MGNPLSSLGETLSTNEYQRLILKFYFNRFLVFPFNRDAGLKEEHIDEIWIKLSKALPILKILEPDLPFYRYTALTSFVSNYPKFEREFITISVFKTKEEIEAYFEKVKKEKDYILELLFGKFSFDQVFPHYIKLQWDKLLDDKDNWNRFEGKIKEALKERLLD